MHHHFLPVLMDLVLAVQGSCMPFMSVAFSYFVYWVISAPAPIAPVWVLRFTVSKFNGYLLSLLSSQDPVTHLAPLSCLKPSAGFISCFFSVYFPGFFGSSYLSVEFLRIWECHFLPTNPPTPTPDPYPLNLVVVMRLVLNLHSPFCFFLPPECWDYRHDTTLSFLFSFAYEDPFCPML